MSAYESPGNAAQTAPRRETGDPASTRRAAETSISTTVLTRILTALIAVWSLVAGLVLVLSQGSGSSALGAGVQDVAGQRLLGAHLIVLTPAFGLIAWRHEQYRGLSWLPFASQLAVFFAVGYSILIGDTEFGDGMLPVAVSGIFIGLLGFVWISEQRNLARMRLADEGEDGSGEDAAADQPPDRPF